MINYDNRFAVGGEGADAGSPLACLSEDAKKAMADALKALFEAQAGRLRAEYDVQMRRFSKDWSALLAGSGTPPASAPSLGPAPPPKSGDAPQVARS